jgi:hypothetical protein
MVSDTTATLETPQYIKRSSARTFRNSISFLVSVIHLGTTTKIGRSTGCFIIIYMGGIIDHSSNIPDPVAQSLAEAEYNEGCIAMMAASHLRMLLCELTNITDEGMPPTSIYFDSRSSIAMGASFGDTKHTRHILRHFHYVRENIAANRFTAQWITTEFQLADIGTKLNDGPRHKLLMDLIMIAIRHHSTTMVQEG